MIINIIYNSKKFIQEIITCTTIGFILLLTLKYISIKHEYAHMRVTCGERRRTPVRNGKVVVGEFAIPIGYSAVLQFWKIPSRNPRRAG